MAALPAAIDLDMPEGYTAVLHFSRFTKNEERYAAGVLQHWEQ